MVSSIKALVPRKGSFGANILTLMTGTTLAQGLTIAVTPILSRLYSPEDFGILSIFMSVATILSALACWRYDMAIVIPRSEANAFNLLALSITLAFALNIVLLAVLFLGGGQIAHLLGTTTLRPWLWWVPLLVFIIASSQALKYWATRQKKFQRVALSEICRNAVTESSRIGYALLVTVGATGLIGGFIAGHITRLLVLAGHVVRQGRDMAAALSFRQMWALFREYKNFALYTPFTSLLNDISSNLLPLILIHFYSTAFLGLFMLGHRLMTLPSQLIIQATYETTYSDLRHLDFAAQRSRLYNIHRHTAFIFALPVLAAFFFPERIEAILGEKWRGVGDILVPLAGMVFIKAIANSVSYFLIFNLYLEQAIANICLIVFRIGSLIVGGLYLSPLGTVYLYAGVNSIVYAAINLRWGSYFSHNRQYLVNIIKSILLSFGFLYPTQWALKKVSFPIFVFFIGVIIVFYYLFIFLWIYKGYSAKDLLKWGDNK